MNTLISMRDLLVPAAEKEWEEQIAVLRGLLQQREELDRLIGDEAARLLVTYSEYLNRNVLN